MTFDEFLRIGELHRKTPAYRRKSERALEIALAEIERHERPYVSVSGGKDSVVCACVADKAARIAGKEIALWAHVSDASFPGTEDTIAELARRLTRPLTFDRCEGSAFDRLKNPERRAFGKTGDFFSSIRRWNEESGCDLCFTGVRAYESRRRMRAAKVHGPAFHTNVAGPMDMCNPLTWYRLEDVAAGLMEYDVPIHPIYRKAQIWESVNSFGEDGFVRLGYITSRDLLNKGTAVFLRANYPEQWRKLCDAWPEARNFV